MNMVSSHIKNRKSNRQPRRGGSVIVLAALATVSLVGFCALAVDYGMMVSDANRLQRASDAAALAGATKLKVTGNDAVDTANARIAAFNMMREHRIANFDASTIQFNSPTFNRITVPASTNRSFFFAGIFRMSDRNSPTTATISRRAVAGRTALRGLPGASPLAITVDDYESYKNGTSFENILIDNNRQDFRPGTMAAIDLRLDSSGKSRIVFQDDLTYGTPGTTIIGQAVNSSLNADLGPQVKSVEDAMNWRIAEAAKAPWFDTGSNYTFPNYPNNDPRIVTLMVADASPANNSNPRLTARFFVNVYVERIRTPGNGAGYLRMRILPSRTYSSDDTGIVVGDDNTPFTGPSVIQLMD